MKKLTIEVLFLSEPNSPYPDGRVLFDNGDTGVARSWISLRSDEWCVRSAIGQAVSELLRDIDKAKGVSRG